MIVLASCHKEEKNTKINSDYSFKIIDSIVINIPDARFADFRKENLLLYNSKNFDISIINLKTKSSKKFNKFGNDSKNYGRINDGNLLFKNDSTIAISTNISLSNYNINGDFLSKQFIDNTTEIAPIKKFNFINDSIVYYISIPEGNTSDISYYTNKRNILIKENVNTHKKTSFSSFPNVKSDIYTEDYYYPYIYDHFYNIHKDKGLISYVNSNGNKIYYYDINNNFKEKSSLDLDLDFYNRLKISFGTKTDRDESIAQAFCSGIIKGNFHSADSIFTIYKKGFSREYIRQFAEENDEFPYYVRPKSEYYLNLIVDGSKITTDIKFDENQGIPLFVKNRDFVLSKKYVTKEEDLEGITTFYILKLIENE